MNGGVAMGGGGDGTGTGPNTPAAGPDKPPAEDKSITVDYPDSSRMVDLDSGSIVLARRPAFAEEFTPDDYQESDDPDVSA